MCPRTDLFCATLSRRQKGGWKTAHLVLHCHRPLEPEIKMNLLSDNLWRFYGDAKMYFSRALILSRPTIISNSRRFQSTAAMANAFWTDFVVLEWMFNLHVLTKSTGSEQLPVSGSTSSFGLFLPPFPFGFRFFRLCSLFWRRQVFEAFHPAGFVLVNHTLILNQTLAL